MIEANKFPPNAVKVVTERGVVYLMGNRKPSRKAMPAGEIAATTSDVVRVVKVFDTGL
jgi:osmotically-inducible protein OsmY